MGSLVAVVFGLIAHIMFVSIREPFCLLVSCLCHDIGHLGANNAFLRQDENSEFIAEFGSESSLEHFHVKKAFEILDSVGFSLHLVEKCCYLKKEQFAYSDILIQEQIFSPEFMHPATNEKLRELLEYLVLATDMEKHDKYMEIFYKVGFMFCEMALQTIQLHYISRTLKSIDLIENLHIRASVGVCLDDHGRNRIMIRTKWFLEVS